MLLGDLHCPPCGDFRRLLRSNSLRSLLRDSPCRNFMDFFAYPVCSSVRGLRGGLFMLEGGFMRISSSSDQSNTAVLRVRLVWSSSREIPPGLRGAVVAIFLFFWAGSSSTSLFPLVFADTGGGLFVRPVSIPPDFEETLTELSSI